MLPVRPLPSEAKYDVYFYFASDGNGRTGSITLGNTTYYYNTNANLATAPYPLTQTTDATGATRPSTNFAEFTGVTGSSFNVYLTRGNNNSGVAAVQIERAARHAGELGEI